MLACDAGLAFRTRLGTSAAAGLRGWVHLAEPRCGNRRLPRKCRLRAQKGSTWQSPFEPTAARTASVD